MLTYEQMRGLTDPQLRLLLFLRDRAQSNPSFKLTTELTAKLANVGEDTVIESLAVLDSGGFITREKQKIISVLGTTCNMNFTNTKDRQTESLVVENKMLHSRVRELEDGDYGELSDRIGAADAAVVVLAEDLVGRFLYAEEIWFLSKITEEFKHNRVKKVLNQQNVRTAKNPLRAAYALLKNGTKGAAFTPKEDTKQPWKPNKTYDPFDR